MSEEIQDAPLVPSTGEPDLIKASRVQFDAVADLLKAAYAKELSLTPEESKALQALFPDDAFRTGAAGKENLIYIEHANLRDRLNEVLGLGQWRLLRIRSWDDHFTFHTRDGDVDAIKVYFEGVLTIRGAYVGSGIGDCDYIPKNNQMNYGDAYEGAKTAAFRRCAKEFGVGLQAWRKEFCDGWMQRNRGGRGPSGDSRTQQEDVQRGQQRHQEQQQRKKAETNAEAVTGGKETQQQPTQGGAANDKRYNLQCPDCKSNTVSRSKWPPRNNPDAPHGWWCDDRKGGCKKNFPYDHPAFHDREPEQAPKDKPKEQDNNEIMEGHKTSWKEWCNDHPGVEGFNKGYEASLEDLKKLSKDDRSTMWNFLLELAAKQKLVWDKDKKKWLAK